MHGRVSDGGQHRHWQISMPGCSASSLRAARFSLEEQDPWWQALLLAAMSALPALLDPAVLAPQPHLFDQELAQVHSCQPPLVGTDAVEDRGGGLGCRNGAAPSPCFS